MATIRWRFFEAPMMVAYITEIDTAKAEARWKGWLQSSPGKNAPDVPHAGRAKAIPEPSPYDRKLMNRKVRHVGDRVVAVVAETLEIARKALTLIDVKYEVLAGVHRRRGDG